MGYKEGGKMKKSWEHTVVSLWNIQNTVHIFPDALLLRSLLEIISCTILKPSEFLTQFRDGHKDLKSNLQNP